MKIKKEGKAKLYLPENIEISKSSEVFYNEKMKINRDFSVVMLNYLLKKENIKIYDMLAASGVRGIRYTKEYLNGNVELYLTEANPKAFEYLKKNLELNCIEANANNKDARIFCLENAGIGFDLVDLDPFGPHIHFTYFSGLVLDRLRSYLFVTITDLSAIYGRAKRALIRKYFGINDIKNIFRDDIGLRIFIASVARELLKHELGIRPIAYHSDAHFIRIFLEVSKKYVDQTVSNIGFYLINDLDYETLPINDPMPLKKGKLYGPLWIGRVLDLNDDLIKILEALDLDSKNYLRKYFNILIKESKFQEKHPNSLALSFRDLMKRFNIGKLPKIDKFIELLQSWSIDCSRSGLFKKEGIRLGTVGDELKNIIKNLNS